MHYAVDFMRVNATGKVEGRSSPFGWDIVSLCLIWLAARIVPFWTIPSLSKWEIWEAKKLLEYGFWERGGAIINWHYMTGLVTNPWDFNYTNHPYPILWLYTLIYYLSGATGITVFVAAIGLFSCVVLYRFLQNQFGTSSAWLATVLCAISPVSIAFDVDPNSVAMGAVIWPMALWCFHRGLAGRDGISRPAPWQTGLAVLVAGQVSWFSLSALPALLWLCLSQNTSWRKALRHPLKIPAWTAIGIGAVVTVVLFLLQLLIYTPSFGDFWGYFLAQSAMSSAGLSRLAMLPQIVAKVLFQVGPALWLGVIVAIVWMARTRKCNAFAVASLCYLAIFGVAGLLLTRFFYTEHSMYKYLLFPTAILAAFAFSKVTENWLRAGAICLAAFGLTFALAKASDTRVTEAARIMGEQIRHVTEPEDVVLTNLRPMSSPYAAWDVGGWENTRRMADRLLRYDIADSKSAAAVFPPLRRKSVPCVFIVDKSKPLSADLEAVLEQHAEKTEDRETVVPTERMTTFLKLRMMYWRLVKRYEPSDNSTGTSTGPITVRLRIYRLRSDALSLEKDNRPSVRRETTGLAAL